MSYTIKLCCVVYDSERKTIFKRNILRIVGTLLYNCFQRNKIEVPALKYVNEKEWFSI